MVFVVRTRIGFKISFARQHAASSATRRSIAVALPIARLRASRGGGGGGLFRRQSARGETYAAVDRRAVARREDLRGAPASPFQSLCVARAAAMCASGCRPSLARSRVGKSRAVSVTRADPTGDLPGRPRRTRPRRRDLVSPPTIPRPNKTSPITEPSRFPLQPRQPRRSRCRTPRVW